MSIRSSKLSLSSFLSSGYFFVSLNSTERDLDLMETLVSVAKSHLFDLKILSKDWEDYSIYFQQIRKEYSIYPDFLYNPGRKKALQHFLEHDYIYQTETFRNLYERQAKRNIQKEIDLL